MANIPLRPSLAPCCSVRCFLRGCLGLILAAASIPLGCRAQQPWPLWERYTDGIMDGQGRVVDHHAGERSTSEGQAYALFFSLVANDRSHFDKVLGWTEANLAGGDLTLRLPAWSWGKAPDGSWKVLDPNPASDADLWMAYCLLEAGRLWREPRYEKLGTVLASRIAQGEIVSIPNFGTTLLPAPEGFHPDAGTWIVNPSYLPPPVLVRLAELLPQDRWGEVLASLHPILAQGSGGGFAMDWVAVGSSIRPAVTPSQPSDRPSFPVGSYDAIRVYLWLGMTDKDTPGLSDLLTSTAGMAGYLKSQITPPLQVDGQGKILSANAPVGFSAAVIPYLHALGMKSQEKAQLNRLGAMRDSSTGLYGKSADYFDQNLALFATGWTEGRFRFDRDGKLIVRWR